MLSRQGAPIFLGAQHFKIYPDSYSMISFGGGGACPFFSHFGYDLASIKL